MPEAELSFAIHPSASPVSAERRAELLARPGFGRVFTDHMITVSWAAGRGWHDAQLRPYGPFTMDPASAVFHYAQEIFEGLKAYRQVSGPIVMFRPRANAARFNRSAARMAMPELPEDAFVQALELLVSHDRDWVPGAGAPAAAEHSLYLRPFMIATKSDSASASPRRRTCSRSSPRRLAPISPAVSGPFRSGSPSAYTRAAPGGTGAAKTGGNYAGGFAGQLEALAHGCEQVVWLDAAEHRFVEEMGGMNLFFVYGSGAGRQDHDTWPDRKPAGRRHQGLAADSCPRSRHTGRRGGDLGRRVAGGL